jgi:hypothetical protein
VKESRNAVEDIKNATRTKYKGNSNPESFEKECFFFSFAVENKSKETELKRNWKPYC